MKLPNAERAVIDDRKLFEYVLSPNHPHGRTHAALFERLLGITRANADVLRRALQQAATSADAIEQPDEGFGTKYEIRFSLDGPRGSYKVLSVWIIDRDIGEAIPRLVTAYIE